MKLRRYMMLYKHIMFNKSFIIALFMVPVLVSIFLLVGNKDEGFFSIGIKSDTENLEFINKIVGMDSVIDFRMLDEDTDPENEVLNGSIDAAWVIEGNLVEEIAECIVKNEYHPVIKVKNKDESISIRYANILLDCILFDEVTPIIFENYSLKFSEYYGNEETFKKAFLNRKTTAKFVESTYLEDLDTKSVALLPVRGLLGLFLVLLGFLISINLSKDYEKGLFVWWNTKNVLIRNYLYYLGPMLAGTVMMVSAQFILNDNNDVLKEILSALLLMLAIIVSSNLLRTIIISPRRMSVFLPVLLLINLVFCPIFVKFSLALGIRLLLPLFYYLRGVTYDMYVYGIIIYILVIVLGQLLLNHFLKRK